MKGLHEPLREKASTEAVGVLGCHLKGEGGRLHRSVTAHQGLADFVSPVHRCYNSINKLTIVNIEKVSAYEANGIVPILSLKEMLCPFKYIIIIVKTKAGKSFKGLWSIFCRSVIVTTS